MSTRGTVLSTEDESLYAYEETLEATYTPFGGHGGWNIYFFIEHSAYNDIEITPFKGIIDLKPFKLDLDWSRNKTLPMLIEFTPSDVINFESDYEGVCLTIKPGTQLSKLLLGENDDNRKRT